MDFDAALALLLHDFAQAESSQQTTALQVLTDFLPPSSPQHKPCSEADLHDLLDAATDCFIAAQDEDTQVALAALIRNAAAYVGALPRQDARLQTWLQEPAHDEWHGYFS